MATKLKEEPCDIKKWFDELWDKTIKLRVKHPAKHKPDITEAVLFWGRKMDNFMGRLPYHTRLNLRKDVKDNAKARELRTKGNQLFHPKVKRYIEAIKHYNESIACSEEGSEERAIAYANRSMICFEMHRYEDCLENIRLARVSNYPERLADKLKNREANARKALLEKANNNNKPYRSGTNNGNDDVCTKTRKSGTEAHIKAPQIADCLKLRRSDEFGRHVVTTRHVPVGDVVLIERPFATVLYDRQRCMQCAYCFSERLFTLIPCEGCTVAMYCSEDCLGEAYRKYHRYECPVIRDLWRIYRNTAVAAMRTVATAIASSFYCNLGAMKEHLDGLDESTVDAFAMNWNTATLREVYNTVHVLETNIRRTNKQDLGLQVFIAVLIRRLLIERSELGPVCAAKPELKEFLFSLILRHLLLNDQNADKISHMAYDIHSTKDYDVATYARVCCPLISMLNHSCDPNVTTIALRDGRCAVVAIRPLAAGDQLFESYGVIHTTMYRDERKYLLTRMFKFRCRCEACLRDYPPILRDADTADDVEIDLSGILDALGGHQVKKAKKVFPLLKSYLAQHGKRRPTSTSCTMQICLVRCFQIIYGYKSESEAYWQYCNP
uniref:MYND-type domain-containing protein n=1 Tax=Anopheles dirus TaxID=7168 RepID=A0A182MXG5_9DIPT